MNKLDLEQILHRLPIKVPQRKLSTPVRVALALLVLFPLTLIIFEAINTYVIYSQAHSGLQHLTNIKTILTTKKSHTGSLLDLNKLRQVQQEMDAAHGDFQQLHAKLQSDLSVGFAGNFFPQQISSARGLSQVGVDATEIGQEVVKSAFLLMPILHGPLLVNNSEPLVTQETLDIISHDITFALPRLKDIETQARTIKVESLPISEQQRLLLNQALTAIPQVRADLIETQGLKSALGWLLGVDKPRTLLVQTMDRGELRATGGFTGQFGELSINHGRIAPFSLKDIGPLEEHNIHSKANGVAAPEPYTSWWPIANWGLRDANVSADFPTSARLAMMAYHDEFGKQMDGVVVFSPFLISRVLQVTGPVTIPQYQETITAQNLEERLHYYQLDNRGILKEVLVEKVPQTPQNPQIAGSQARKLFTKRVASALIDHIRHAPIDELLALAREMLYDLKTKDLQIYVNNAVVEQLIGQYGSTGAIDRSIDHDGLFVTQVNLSVSKASTYVRTYLQDTVTLDGNGGATHLLKMKLVYTQIGSVYGYDTYRDYVRIYVPPTSKYLWGDGFARWFENQPLCGGANRAACPQDDVYGNGTLLCAPNATLGGVADAYLGDSYYGLLHPIMRIGPPTNMVSDEQGRNMYGGWVIVPKNCTMTVTVSWYVPPVKHHPYSLFVQRQSSTQPILDLTILPTPGNCQQIKTAGLHYQGVLGTEDRTFTLPSNTLSDDLICYPHMRV